jgi:ribose transport system permease protein
VETSTYQEEDTMVAPKQEEAVPSSTGDQAHSVKRRASVRELGILGAFAALFLFLSVDNGQFFTSSNLLNIVNQQTTIGFIALAGTLVVIAGGFDLSVGAIFALSGVIAAKLAMSVGPVEGLVLAVIAGMALGVCNGVLVTIVRVNPLIATLATSIIFGGVALVITNGSLIDVNASSFATIGTDKFLGVYWSTWILLAFTIACAVLLARTRFGRYVFAVGGNEEAARLSGLRVGLIRTATYTLSGAACGLAAMLYTSQVQTADPTVGATYPLAAIAAIVVGGTSLNGGEGAIWRTVVGVLLLGEISDGFNLLSINPLYQQIVQGAIILVAVGLDVWVKRGRR